MGVDSESDDEDSQAFPGEAVIEAVYRCPECKQTFSRWKFLVTHFKARQHSYSGTLDLDASFDPRRHAEPCPDVAPPSEQTSLHWTVPLKGQRALQRKRRACLVPLAKRESLRRTVPDSRSLVGGDGGTSPAPLSVAEDLAGRRAAAEQAQ